MAAHLLPSAPAIRKDSLFENPVVLRDLRSRMRGRRAYWHIAFYLFLLGTLAVSGYSSSLSGAGPAGKMSMVDAQNSLQGFYYFIFMSIAALVCLMAPAITAVAVTSERQRLTIDMLVSTPMTAGKMLVGKLISSFAFLALLLVLSLPASALCVIVGGATIGDVARIYAILAMDGLVFAAIGLCFSCIARTNTAAIVSTYVVVLALLIVTYVCAMLGTAFMGGTGGPAVAVAALNPFFAVVEGSGSFNLGPTSFQDSSQLNIPTWIGSLVFAFLLVRLLVTIAEFRLGSYGSGTAASLRRQALLLIVLVSYIAGESLFGREINAHASLADLVAALLIWLFVCGAFFLPSLFTPALNVDDKPPGWTGKTALEQAAESSGWYRIRNAFVPEQGAALPFFHLCLIVLAIGVILAAWIDDGAKVLLPLLATLCRALFYLSAVGFLFWAVARRVAHWVDSVSNARALALAAYILIVWLPFSIAWLSGIATTDYDWALNPVLVIWVLYPLSQLDKGDLSASLLSIGAACYAAGILVFPFWKPLRTGYKTTVGRQNAVG